MTTQEKLHLIPPGGWIDPGSVRLPPLSLHEIGIGPRLLVRLVNSAGQLDAANLFMMMMRNFRLFRSWLPFVAKLMPFGEIARRETELIILRVAWNCRSRYEWGQHVDIGMRAGLTVDDIRRIPHGPDAPGWLPHESVLMYACDEFHRDRVISEPIWQRLAELYSTRHLLEVLMVIGHYEMLAGILNSTGLQLDKGLEAKLSAI
jgi:alkylhydroperoxidase family enzyme